MHFSLKIYFSLTKLSQIWQQAEVSCAILGLYNLCFKYMVIKHHTKLPNLMLTFFMLVFGHFQQTFTLIDFSLVI